MKTQEIEENIETMITNEQQVKQEKGREVEVQQQVKKELEH
jgi:hypothetical protein